MRITSASSSKSNSKKFSKFQKLWARAEKVKKDNERFRETLDRLVERVNVEVMPQAQATGKAARALMVRLLGHGKRKSLTKWERGEIDDWVQHCVEEIYPLGLVDDDLLEEIARYDAFRNGIVLDDDERPAREQLGEKFRERERDYKESLDREEQEIRAAIDELIDKRVRMKLDPPPTKKKSLTWDCRFLARRPGHRTRRRDGKLRATPRITTRGNCRTV